MTYRSQPEGPKRSARTQKTSRTSGSSSRTSRTSRTSLRSSDASASSRTSSRTSSPSRTSRASSRATASSFWRSHSSDSGDKGAQRAGLADFIDVKDRAFFPLVPFAIIAILLFARLFFVQIIDGSRMASEAEKTRTSCEWIEPRRGTIYDRNGVVLATSVKSATIYVDPSEVTNPDLTSQVLVDVLGGQKSDYMEAVTAPNTRYSVIKHKADIEVGERLQERVDEVMRLQGACGAAVWYQYIFGGADSKPWNPDEHKSANLGIHRKILWRREYPNAQVGGQVVGLCKIFTEPGIYREYYKGISGLEMYYDDVLSGEVGYTRQECSPSGKPIAGGVKEFKPAVDGQDIIISIDIELQQYIEERLSADEGGITAQGGSALVMDSATGEIYAAASLPLLDPVNRDEIKEGATKLKCVTDLFEPGSVFKAVSAMTVLESKSMTPETELFCPSSIEASGYSVSDAHDRPDTTYTLRQILAQSSNVGISLAVERAASDSTSGFERLYNNIFSYNLHTETGVDYPGEQVGYLVPFEKWSKIEGYNASFGQGFSLTPLQITRFYSALVNDGVECTPHFLISKPQTNEVAVYKSQRIIDDKEAIDDMVDMLKSVVSEGTGVQAAIDGFDVAGKTSTAEIYDEENGGYREGVYNLAFIGFLPDSSSQLVCFVGANEVPTDGVVTPIFKDIMTVAIDRFNIYPK